MSARVWGALAAATALVLGGCSATLSDVPMPGGVSGPTYRLDAVFENALNLPPDAPVKLEGRTVGTVDTIRAVDYLAHVSIRVSTNIELPVGTRAQIRLAAPVGEAFVALNPPEDDGGALLRDGDQIPVSLTGTAPDTTDLLTGLSLAVTGGSYADLKVIIDEATVILGDGGADIRGLLREIDTLVTTFNTRSATIDDALDGLDRLSGLLADDTDSLMTSARQIAPALERLAEREDALVDLLESVAGFGAATEDAITQMRGTIARQLTDASAVIEQVTAAQDHLRPLLTGIQGFADALDRATPGDYAAFDLTISASPGVLLGGDLPLLPLSQLRGPIAPEAAGTGGLGLVELVEGLVPQTGSQIDDVLKRLLGGAR